MKILSLALVALMVSVFPTSVFPGVGAAPLSPQAISTMDAQPPYKPCGYC